MRELGNLLFGHSNGEFYIDEEVWIPIFEPLLELLAKLEPNSAAESYGLDIDTTVFTMRPYWWGECTCGAGDGGLHKSDCHYVLPNFLYKPTNYAIWWYKWPFRDSYANQDISPAVFKKSVATCVAALGRELV